jgi:ABC-type multidrug transport system ATPase subunit
MVPEGREVFGGLTIDENLKLGAGMRADKDQVARDLEQVYAVFPVLRDRKDSQAGVLSGGQQQMLVIGRALMAGPKLIAIDEPSLGLAPKVIDDVYATLIRLRDSRGLTLLIVEQSATRASLTGGRMVLMRSGEVVERFADSFDAPAGELSDAWQMRADGEQWARRVQEDQLDCLRTHNGSGERLQLHRRGVFRQRRPEILPVAAAGDGRAFPAADLHVRVYRAQLLLIDERAHVRRFVQTIAQSKRFGPLH